MGFFDSTKDFFNGFSNSLKKEYSPFLSSALLHFPNFKIEKLEDNKKYSIVSTNEGPYKIYLSIKENQKKINELNTQIFHFIDEPTNKVENHKPINDFFSFEEYKKIRNISKKTTFDINSVSITSMLENQYLEIKNNRSYFRYLNEPENRKKITHYRNIIENDKRINDAYPTLINANLNEFSLYEDLFGKMDKKYHLDCNFKDFDPIERLSLRGQMGINYILKQLEFESRNKYRFMDVWVLNFYVVNINSEIIFEDIVLINGMNGYHRKLHEDDFLFISEGVNEMTERWRFFKYNYL